MKAASHQWPKERYRSGHNGADSKSDGQGNLARGFESHPLRQSFSYCTLPTMKLASFESIIHELNSRCSLSRGRRRGG